MKLFMSSTFFSLTHGLICDLTNFLNLSQIVLLDVILEGLSLVSDRWCKRRNRGERSDNRSYNELVLIRLHGKFFVTVGQYMGKAGETQSSPLPTYKMAFSQLGVTKRDRQCGCLVL